MKFIFLTKDYFNRHPSSEFPEMLRKSDRPYVQLTIPCNHQLWAVPLRSYINHEFAFWSNKKELCGLDFTKAVPIELKDIDTMHSPIIRRHEFNALKGKDYRVTQRFKHFIKKFDHAKLHPTLPDSKDVENLMVFQGLGCRNNKREQESVALFWRKKMISHIKVL